MTFAWPLTLVVLVTLLRKAWPGAQRRRLLAWIVACLFIAGPLLIEPTSFITGPVQAGLSLAMAMKLVDVQGGRVHPQTLCRVWRFLVWFIIPPRTQWEPDRNVRRLLRRGAVKRWLRMGLKVLLLLALIRLDVRHTLMWPGSAWAAAFSLYFMISGVSDLVTGATMMAGFATQEVFRAPFLARSPADFWGQRWNFFVNQFFRRHIFFPLVKGGHIYRASGAVFLVSGLAHEYFAYVCVSRDKFLPGYMTLFFLLQGVAVMTATWWRGHLRPLRFAPAPFKVGAHLFWLAATSWLFIKPIEPVLESLEGVARTLLVATGL